jgi:hydroxymethyl cephem carbamoyltransferase
VGGVLKPTERSSAGRRFPRRGVRPHVSERLPLLLSGGCALNCDWNSRWESLGIFSDIFIPPCANDTGSAIGTAIDAQWHFTGQAKLSWSVYSGEFPVRDVQHVQGFVEVGYDVHSVARELARGKVIGWVRGRYEIGPRALGARSMLASPIAAEMLKRLNEIKRREGFRPIAPVCTEEALADFFHPSAPSPFMLKFRQVSSERIPAVTHIDKSARPQSVSSSQNPSLHALLDAFGSITGVPVLCNTSLNFNGKGFINRLSDLGRLAVEQGLDAFVFEDRFFLREGP